MAEVVGGSCGMIFQSILFFLRGVWKLVERDGSALPAVISCPSGEGRQLPPGRGWGMCSQHSDTLDKGAAGLVVPCEAAPFLRNTSGDT